MTLFKRHMGRQAAAIGVAVALLVLGLATPAYAAVPTVTSVTPSAASRTCEVTIIGTGFTTGGTASVTFSGANGTGETADSSTQMEVTIPNSVGASSPANVVVTNSDGPSTPAFTYSTGPDVACPGAPTPSPTSGIVGSTVTISGTFNSTVTGVRFNTSSLVTPTNASTTSATAVVPAGTTTGPVHVYTAAGQKTGGTFTVVPVPAPTITSFTPAFGPTGTSVKITGTNFSGTVSGASFTTTGVTFNNVVATFVVNSATQITATVPSTATTGPIKVTTPGGSFTTPTNFTVSKTHSRSVSLKLSKHIRAKGSVSVGDGFTACVASVPVKIQRKSKGGGWNTVGTATTSSSGSYSKKLKDKSGKYRAKATKVALSAGVDVCLKATSAVRKHND